MTPLVPLLTLVVFFASVAKADDDTSWHLLVQTEAGDVSLVKGLSQHACEHARDKLIDPHSKRCDNMGYDAICTTFPEGGFSIKNVEPNDAKIAECFQ